MTRTAKGQTRRVVLIRHGIHYACGHEWPKAGDPQRRTVLYWTRATNPCAACATAQGQEDAARAAQESEGI